MLWVLRDASGRFQAAAEWHPVNAQGQPASDGTYVWIQQFELGTATMEEAARAMIRDLAWAYPQMVAVYWRREDHREPHIIQFSRQQVLSYANHEEGKG